MNTLDALQSWLDNRLNGFPETVIYGFADLDGLLPPPLAKYPQAVSFAVRMDDSLMDSVHNGPSAPYYAEYTRVNVLIDALAAEIAGELERGGWEAHAVHSSQRTDAVAIAGEFPHKTGAVRSGLGWIGRNCQLVTRSFGPRVRLGTVLTNCPLGSPAAPTERSFCGDCDACVQVCPTQALTGAKWHPGDAREKLLDASRCDAWKKTNYAAYDGNVCGICTSACPMGTTRRKEKRRTGPGEAPQ